VTTSGERVLAAILREGAAARLGSVQLTDRDIRALVWCGEMYGIRAGLLAGLLGVSGDVVRQLHARWRRAGLAETGRLGPGPVWCWLTRAGLEACGLPYASYRPPLGRLAHVHAAGSVRAALEAGMPIRKARRTGGPSGGCAGGWAAGRAGGGMCRTGRCCGRMPRRTTRARRGVWRWS
jgi:hypothetical protein